MTAAQPQSYGDFLAAKASDAGGHVKPPICYFGGKVTLGPDIARLLPAHEHYLEPYAGSLAVLLAKPRSAMETVSDLDGDLMTFWRVLRDRPDELATRAALTPHSRAEYRACSVWIRDPNREPVDDLETARRVWVCLNQGRAGVLRASGWRHYVNPAGSSSSMPDYLAGYVGRMCPAAERLAGVTLESVAALDLIVKYGREPAALLYVDPPYLGSTRPGTYGKDAYRHELKTEAEHRELAEALRGARAAVVLSGYPSPLYDEQLYPDWHRVTFPASTGQGGTWENRTEVLWSNRPLDTARQRSLFDSEDVS